MFSLPPFFFFFFLEEFGIFADVVVVWWGGGGRVREVCGYAVSGTEDEVGMLDLGDDGEELEEGRAVDRFGCVLRQWMLVLCDKLRRKRSRCS